MLSVLIPVYRVDVTQLVLDLHAQCKRLNISFEICLRDDHSDDMFRNINRQLALNFEEVKYSENPANLGRSISRNLLIQDAQYEWMYFLDCDSDVSQNPNLILHFWQQKDENTLLSGGRIYQSNPPVNNSFYLHWLWGSARELISAPIRMRDPINHFLSNNFILHQNITERVNFDAQIKGYGYEDTLFAADVVATGFKIKHIENPLIHAGLDPTDLFLGKIEESLINLKKIEEICLKRNIPNPLKSKLISTWKATRNWMPPRLTKLFLPLLKKKLGGRNPKLLLFDLYRLFYLLSLPRK